MGFGGIPLDKTKNFGTWKISTLKNIYRKYLARYPIIYLHVFFYSIFTQNH